jgi:hypothetical protein
VVFTAELILEPDLVDPNAVKVCIRGGAQVDYLSRDDAGRYHLALKTSAEGGHRGVCRARLIGGTEDRPSLGVILDLRPAHDLRHALGQRFQSWLIRERRSRL